MSSPAAGDFVHNLRTWKRDGGDAYPWATSFNEAVKSAFERGDHDALIDWVGSGRGRADERADG